MKKEEGNSQREGKGAGSLVSCQLEMWLPVLPQQGHDSSSAGDAPVRPGRPCKHPWAT